MKLLPKNLTDLKNLKSGFLVLSLGMIVASVFLTYCMLTKPEVLESSPKLWIVVVVIYLFTALSILYYTILLKAYDRMKRDF